MIVSNLPTNGGESLILMTAILFGLALPITAVQSLWRYMITAVALDLTLNFEPPEPSVMERQPSRRSASLLDVEMLWCTVFVWG